MDYKKKLNRLLTLSAYEVIHRFTSVGTEEDSPREFQLIYQSNLGQKIGYLEGKVAVGSVDGKDIRFKVENFNKAVISYILTYIFYDWFGLRTKLHSWSGKKIFEFNK